MFVSLAIGGISRERFRWQVLNMATEDSDNPDLRDRGYVYWRLLSTNPDAAKAVVLAEKPTIADDTFTLEPGLLDDLIQQLSTLASIYHKYVREREGALSRKVSHPSHACFSQAARGVRDAVGGAAGRR